MRKLLAMSAGALLCVAGTAGAAPLVLPTGQPIVLDFSNVEQLNVNNPLSTCIATPGTTSTGGSYGCSDNWGFIRVNTINTSVVNQPNTDIDDTGVSSLYNTTANGSTEIFGLFYGINLTGCSGTGSTTCTATGGVLDLYWHESGIAGVSTIGDLDPTAASVDAVDAGQFLVRLLFAPGIISNDPNTTITSDVDLTTTFGQGAANGFLNVDTSAGGLWASALNGNWFFIDGPDAGTVRGDAGVSEQRDVKFRNTFNRVTDPDNTSFNWNAPGIVGLTSSDPAEAFTAVPEPATLTLLGLGLAGAAARRRRRTA